MRARTFVAVLIAALGCAGLVAPAQAAEELSVTWPSLTSLGNETPYRFQVTGDTSNISYLAENGTRYPLATNAGFASIDFDVPGVHHVALERCLEPGCEVVATSPDFEVYDEARVTSVVTRASMGPNSSKDVTISVTKPADWDHYFVTWKLSRTTSSPVVASGSATAHSDSSGNGRFALRIPATVPTARYLLRLHVVAHDPDGPSLPTDTEVSVVWERASSGQFGPTPTVIYPRRTHPTRFVGVVTTAWSSELKRASAVVVDSRGRAVRTLPVTFESFGHRIKVGWNGRINGQVRAGTYVVRVSWLDWAANRGKAQRQVRVSGAR